MRSRSRYVLSIVAMALGAGVLLGQALEAAPRAGPRITVRDEDGGLVREILIEARDGRVAWADLLRALSRMNGFDDAALPDLVPGGSFRLDRLASPIVAVPLRLCLPGPIEVRRLPPARAGGEPFLEIRIDRASLEARIRERKDLLRRAALRALGAGSRFGIEGDAAWRDRGAGRNAVLLVHGLDASPECLEPFAERVQGEGLAVAVFSYPGSQPVRDSALLLSRELRRVARELPGLEVVVVAFSMGGLVAREAIEDPVLDPGNVRRLVLVATPNGGSRLAALEPVLKIAVEAQGAGGPVRKLLRALENGLGDAGEDLRPGSVFLRRLDRRPRNPAVVYSLLLGDGGPLGPAEPRFLRECVDRLARKSRAVRFLAKPAREWLGDLDEVVRGRGDGAVALERGRLAGVEDTVVLHFSHLEMLSGAGEPETAELWRAILERLGRRP